MCFPPALGLNRNTMRPEFRSLFSTSGALDVWVLSPVWLGLAKKQVWLVIEKGSWGPRILMLLLWKKEWRWREDPVCAANFPKVVFQVWVSLFPMSLGHQGDNQRDTLSRVKIRWRILEEIRIRGPRYIPWPANWAVKARANPVIGSPSVPLPF